MAHGCPPPPPHTHTQFSLTTNTRVGITLEYTDAVTKAAVSQPVDQSINS